MHKVKVESYVITDDGDILCLPMWQVIFYFSPTIKEVHLLYCRKRAGGERVTARQAHTQAERGREREREGDRERDG